MESGAMSTSDPDARRTSILSVTVRHLSAHSRATGPLHFEQNVAAAAGAGASTSGSSSRLTQRRHRRPSRSVDHLPCLDEIQSVQKGSRLGCFKDIYEESSAADDDSWGSDTASFNHANPLLPPGAPSLEPCGIDLTANLPDECLALVFRRLGTADLGRCALVCSRWARVDADSRGHICLRANEDIVPALPSVVARFPALTKVVLKSDKASLSIDDCGLAVLANLCPSLRKLKLKNCKQVTDEGLDMLARLRPELKKFSCGSCGFGMKGLNALLMVCTSLEELTVKRSIKVVYDRNQETLTAGSGSLLRLCLKDQSASHLWRPLIAGSEQLQTLMLARNAGYWDRVLETSLGNGNHKALSQIYLERVQITDRGLQAIAKCPQLEALVIVRAPECTDIGLAAIAAGCPDLKRVHVEGWAPGHVLDSGLLALAINCRQLQELVLVGHSATVASLSQLAALSCQLERLTLCASDTITDAEVACLAHGCPRLRRLCVKDCERVTDLGFIALANGCPRLHKLKIRRCRGVTLNSISFLQRQRPELAMAIERRLWQEEEVHLRTQDDSVIMGSQRIEHGTAGRRGLTRARQALSCYVASTFKKWIKSGRRDSRNT